MNTDRAAPAKETEVKIIGITVHRVTLDDLKYYVASCTEGKRIIGNHNLHSIYLCHKDKKMRLFYSRADLIHIDGMSIVLIAYLLGYDMNRKYRLAVLDWIFPILNECADNNLRVFFLGSKPGVAEKAIKIFRSKAPSLKVGFHHGYFDAKADSRDNLKIINQINQFRTNILFVGMGMPRQEHWILDNIDKLNINIVCNVGALMDYFADEQKLPPRWMGRVGLEWLFRLSTHPKRLWRRYLLEPWFVLKLVMYDIMRKKLLKKDSVDFSD